jgi:hypothetical protein
VAERNGEGERAARLLGAVRTLAERPGIIGFAQRQESQLAQSSTLKTLGEEVWRPLYAQGHALSLEEATTEALGEEKGKAE